LKVLLAEDDEISRHILKETLVRWGYEVVTACDGAEAWEILQAGNGPELAILDWIMPGMDGIDVCRHVREKQGEPYIYVMLLTSKTRKADIIQGMGAGADDYISKPFDPQELQMRLNAGRRIIELQSQLLATRESLRYMVSHDSLTGLFSRVEILEQLRGELNRAGRDRAPVGVIIADVDHFKVINDTHGHLTGDVVLIEIARRLRRAVRSYDHIGRYGGEEFLILMPGCDEDESVINAERVRASVMCEPVVLPAGDARVTISAGVATGYGDDNLDFNGLIRIADAALYRAKAQGRNQVVLGTMADSRDPHAELRSLSLKP
jgi:two-component system, cell cycle response regulator